MKKVWKWVIGIVAGLVVVAALVGAAFLVRSRLVVKQAARLAAPGLRTQRPGMMPFHNNGWGGHGGYMVGPGMMGHGMMPFGGFFGGLLSLGLLALIVLGIIWLVRSLRKPAHVVETPVAAPAAIAAHACPKCGRTVQDDWQNCPYCGKKL